jgi:hypothetical protein
MLVSRDQQLSSLSDVPILKVKARPGAFGDPVNHEEHIMKIAHVGVGVVLAGMASVAACAATAQSHAMLGPSWMAMILGVASIGAVIRSRRARAVGAADM